MSEGFTKLFSSITDSSVWMEDSDTRIVWVTLLAMADADGYVGASIPGIASRARVPLDVTERALERFQQPDKYSRTKEHEGRRIAEAERGWLILNHGAYRENRSAGSGNSLSMVDRPGRVYFIRCGEAIKIGFSQNPWARLNALKTGSPVEPELIGHIAGTMVLERELQTKFASAKINREWFRPTKELLAYIASVVDGSSLPVATVAGQSTTVVTLVGSVATTGQLQPEAEAEAEAEKKERTESACAPPAPELQPIANDLVAENEQTEASGVFERGSTGQLVRRFHVELLAELGTFPSQSKKTAESYAALTDWATQAPDAKRALQVAFLGFREDSWASERTYPIGLLANDPSKYHRAGMALLADREAAR
jgi:hypothetical protein